MARPNALRRSRRRSATDDGPWKGMGRAIAKLEGMSELLLPEVGDLMFESIVDGSRITSAPGQPVDDADLKGSWRLEFPTEDSVQVVTDSPYARPNEDGVRQGGKPYVQKSPVGGRHSVRLTRRGLQGIVNEAAKRVDAGVG